MPKHSDSRSRSRDRKRDHKQKDKKKHKKHSRSRDRSMDRHRDSRRHGSSRDKGREQDDKHRSDSGRSRDNNFDRRDGGDYRQNDNPSYGQRDFGEEVKNSRFSSQPSDPNQVLKKSSRFSEQRKYPLMLTFLALGPPQQQAASRSVMPPPSNIPMKRRKFVWTDADESEIRDSSKIKTYDESQPALMLGSNPSLLQKLNPAILSALQDSSKIKKKIYLPKNTGVNYIGLLIGPRGLYQKRLEEESGCKILIRGKGSQKEGAAPQPDDDDEQHVLVIGDSADSVRRAQNAIERVISADDDTRNKIREEQLNVAAQINNQAMPNSQVDDSMMTPYGPPSPYAYIIPVPNDCVGLIIGKGGETIRQLQMESGAKIQVAKKEIPNSNLRNVFVEGSTEKYQRAREMIEEIIREHRRNSDPQIHVGDINPFTGPSQKLKVPDKYVGLIIGKNGENLRGIAQRSNTKIFVPQKNLDPGAEERTIEVEGDNQSIEIARQEILSLIQRYVSQSGGGFDYSKNPYGSGIAVYNQTKISNDPNVINGAVPDSLRPDAGSYASTLLTDNPMIAYASMQLTGWSYDDQNKPLDPEGKLIYNQNSIASRNDQGQDQQYQEGYDYNYQQQPYYPQQPGYDAQAYPGYDQSYYQHYYGQNYYPQPGQPHGADQHPQNPETQAQPSTDTQNAPQQTQAHGDQSQAYQDWYNQYYQYYGVYPTADQYAYPQHYGYGGYAQQPDSGAYPQHVQGQPGTQGSNGVEGQQEPNQQPAQ